MLEIKEISLLETLAINRSIREIKSYTSTQSYESRFTEKGFLSLGAFVDSEIVGFKLGYWLNSDVFYSWLGGVQESHRKKGIAQLLLNRQEESVSSHGAKSVRVKSGNSYPAMMILLIKNSYQIIGTEKSKVLFEKSL